MADAASGDGRGGEDGVRKRSEIERTHRTRIDDEHNTIPVQDLLECVLEVLLDIRDMLKAVTKS